MKGIEIPFGAKDSELCGWEYTIPEGMEAVVEGGKVIVRRKESEDERIRKWLIAEIKATHDYDSPTSAKCVDDAIAWLERQKKQKPAEWDFPHGVNETVDKLIAIAECLEMDGDCSFNGYTGAECEIDEQWHKY